MGFRSYKDNIHLSKVVWISDKREFEELMYQGLEYYGHKDKPVEHMVFTAESGEQVDLMKCFRSFQIRILRNVKFGYKRKIDFIGVILYEPHYHIHVLIRKPIIEIELMRKLWEYSYKENSHIFTRYVFKDKTSRGSMKKIVTYIMNQPESHETQNYRYFRSSGWGGISGGETVDANLDGL